jgi:hypothetical protein
MITGATENKKKEIQFLYMCAQKHRKKRHQNGSPHSKKEKKKQE